MLVNMQEFLSNFVMLLLLLLLNHFSRVRLCATPQTAAHQAPPSLGFSRQEHWSGLPFLLQCMTVKSLSRVRLLATPWTAAHQSPLSMGFSREEYWRGVPFPSPMHESEVAQLCPTLSDPMDCSPPGSSIHGIFQGRVLERGAIAFSVYIGVNIYKIQKVLKNEEETIQKKNG